MIGQAFVFAQPVDVLRLIGSGNHVESKKGYYPKESAFVFQKKKNTQKTGSARQAKTNRATLAKSCTEFQRVCRDPETQ